MGIADLKSRLLAGETLVSTFVKTPALEIIEVLAGSGLDYLVLDAEHSPFDRARLDGCLAIGRALDFPILVRVPAGTPADILMVLDCGAVGVVVPHVDTPQKAQAIGKAAHFGLGGRGYAGSTRWAGYATRAMEDVLSQDDQTIVMAQIEEPAGVENIDAIAAAEGIDAVFIGPSDLSISYGHTSADNEDLHRAMTKVGAAAKAAGVAYVTWVPNAGVVASRAEYGFTSFVVGSEHSWMLQGAKATVAALKD